MEQKRIGWLDIARGLAMLGVIYGHVLPREAGFGKWIYSWHMPIFFLITGILLAARDDWRKMSFRDLFVKDLKSIMYPYLIFNIIEVVIVGFTSSLKDALTGVFHFCILDGLQALWFLSALFIARQVFFQLMKRTGRKDVIAAFVTAVAIATSLFAYLPRWINTRSGIMHQLYLTGNIGNRSLIGFVFLMLGFAGAGYLHSIMRDRGKKILCMAGLLIISVALFNYNSAGLRFSKIGNPALYYLLAVAGSVFIFILSDLISNWRLMEGVRFVGVNSIVFLITHIPVRNLLAAIFPSVDQGHKAWFFLMVLAVDYGVCWIVIRYLPFLYKWKGRPKVPSGSKS